MDMNNIYYQAMLSEASYADFRAAKASDGSYITEKVKAALIDKGFSETQATEFVSKWRVVDHQPNTPTGFSATLFERIDNPGELVFAVRGTEPSEWRTDVQKRGRNYFLN